VNEPKGRGTEEALVTEPADMELYDLRVTVESIEGRSVCGLSVGDYFELTESSRLRLPPGRRCCPPSSASCRRRTGWSATRWSPAPTRRSG
jgi:hypothetical protein